MVDQIATRARACSGGVGGVRGEGGYLQRRGGGEGRGARKQQREGCYEEVSEALGWQQEEGSIGG